MVKDPKEPIGRIERTTREGGFERRVADVQPPPRQPVTAQPARTTDQFKPIGALERFLHAISRRVEQGVGFYHTIRLPGRGRVVHDRRAGDDSERTADEASTKPNHPPRDASHNACVSKKHPHYFGDRTRLMAGQGGQSGSGEAAAPEKPLTAFETTLVERFEDGAVFTKPLASGSFHFLKKTASEWMQFFKSFLHRTVKKEAQLQALSEQMVFRGLLKETAQPLKGMMIGDLAFQNGLVEKFARFEVELARVLPQLQGMEPGTTLAKATIAQGIPTDLLQYFAIAAATPEAEIFAGPKESAGIFTALKTEAHVAEQLGWSRKDHVGRFGGGAGNDGGGAFGEPALGEDNPNERFVPWWRWDREERGGLRRWFVPVMLATLVAVLAISVWVLMRSV